MTETMIARSLSLSPPANWTEPSSRETMTPSRIDTVALNGPRWSALSNVFLPTALRLGRCSAGLGLGELGHPGVVPLLHLGVLLEMDLHRDLRLELLRRVEEQQGLSRVVLAMQRAPFEHAAI